MRYLHKLVYYLRAYGIGYTWRRGIDLLALWLGFRPIEKLRQDLARKIDREFNSTIAYGPMKGLTFISKSWWGLPDRAGMIFGLYEQNVLEALVEESNARDVFIDVGAADGYYAVGMVNSGHFERSVCYEIDEMGQSAIAELAANNGCADRVQVFGAADRSSLLDLRAETISNAVILWDIEGFEYELLTDPDILEHLRDAVLIVELHTFDYPGGETGEQELLNTLGQAFELDIIEYGPRDPASIPEARNLPDDLRWLICSERRSHAMRWARAKPRFAAVAE